MAGMLLFAAFGLFLFFLVFGKKRSNPALQVYGPKSYPVVGSLFTFWKMKISSLLEWQTDMLQRSPTQTFVFHCLAGIPTVVTANPANVEHILKTRFENYPKGEQFTGVLHDLLGTGIFNVDGDAWKLQRKVASREFNTRSLRSFIVQVVEEVTGRLLPLLRDASERGQCLDLQDVLRRLSFDTVCKVAFGIDPACLNPSMPVFEFARAFDVATELSARRATVPISLVWKLKRHLNVGSERRLAHAVKVVHKFATDVIRRRRKEMGNADLKQDLLSRLMDHPSTSTHRPDDQFVRDSVINFILAGRDTTAAALTWFFWLLSLHPNVEQTIRQESGRVVAARSQSHENALLFSYEELQSMHYLHAAICESMRLYPPVPFDSKHALQNDVLPDGTFVAKGTRVTYHPYAMGRMKSIWGPDCLEFKAERWLNEEGVFVPQSTFKYAVFQAGLRVCLGREMAFIQMKYVAAAVIAEFRLRPVDCNVERKCISNLTACMVGGLPVLVHPIQKL